MAVSTPILPIVDAMAARITADTAIMTLLRAVYSTEAHIGTPFPYLVFSNPSAVPEVLTFHKTGHSANQRLNIYSVQMNEREVAAICNHLERLFAFKPLTLLPDHQLLIGTIHVIGIFQTQDKKNMQGVVDYRAQTRAVA